MEKDTTTLVQALVAMLLILGISVGMVYWVTATSYEKKVETVKSSYSAKFKELADETTQSQTIAAQIKETRFWCTDCHRIVEEFHNPEDITVLAVAKNRSARVCVQCHGFTVHTIHKNKLESGQVVCNTCHEVDGIVRKPVPREGDIVVCEQCHWDGNFIDIHINYGKATCLNCHVGGVSNVHKKTLMNAQKDLIDEVPNAEKYLQVIEVMP